MIRTARPDESELLQAICLDADRAYVEEGLPELANDPFPLTLLERASDAGRVFVEVDVEDHPIGWVLLSLASPEPCVAQIAVAPAHGRRGVGTRLMAHVAAIAAERGHATLVLNTDRHVPWNAPWYLRLGYEMVDESDWTDDMRQITAEQIDAGLDWARRVHMRLWIDASCT